MSQFVPLVVVGGSAGSLAPMQAFFHGLKQGCGYAYIVLQHMSPDHESHLAELIGKQTGMVVCDLFEGTRPQQGFVYVVHPGQLPMLKEGVFCYAQQMDAASRHHVIDRFCESLSPEQAATAVLVVLSGTGRDGQAAAGIVKDAGGMVMVQDPDTAGFSAMPLSVLEFELADFVLSCDRMGEVICNLSDQDTLARLGVYTRQKQQADNAFESILTCVSNHTKQDMAVYKPTTLRRRIKRRMGMSRVERFDQYLRLIQNNLSELEQLSKDLLIGVTSFFRDGDAFRVIETLVVPALCEAAANDPVRVWVAGCSTGEEVYSIAILMMEWFAKRKRQPGVQIFATDIDDVALEVARIGYYEQSALAHLDADLLSRYFHEERAGYRINKDIRERIVFAAHNLIMDPPFSKLDLVVCRNLLIYLNPVNQKKVLGLFHFVLNPHGYLFLGSSENIGNVGRHFQPVSKQWRIYSHAEDAPRRPPALPLVATESGARDRVGALASLGGMVSQERYYRKILENYGPTQVLVDAQHQLLFVSGDASPYLSIASGEVSFDLFKITRPELNMALRSALSDATEQQQPVTISVTSGEGYGSAIRIEVFPIGPTAEGSGNLLICFSTEPANKSAQTLTFSGGDDWVLQQLVQELNATREDLQRTIEHSRASSEEMRAANEEVMAMNEELQSANEELESSKEELQSLNEELVTSNANLDAKIAEVEALNADLTNLLMSAESATLLLDDTLQIRHFTPACSSIMRVIPTDVGRSFEDVVKLFTDPALHQDCERVLMGRSVPSREIAGEDGSWFLRRVLPYRTPGPGKVISGLVISFMDISELKQADRLLQARTETLQWQANLLSRAAPIVGRDLTDRVIFWNKGAEQLYGWSEQEVTGKLSHELLHAQYPKALEQIMAELNSRGVWKGEVSHIGRKGERILVESQWTLFLDEQNRPTAIVEVNNDITEKREAQQALDERETMFRTMVDWTYNWEYWMAPNGQLVYMTPSAERLTGYQASEFMENPKLLDFIVHELDRDLWDRFIGFDYPGGSVETREIKLRLIRKNGEARWMHLTCRPVTDHDGLFQGLRLSVRDVSDQVRAEDQIRHLVNFDSLTELPNRRLLMDRLNQIRISSHRNGRYSALLLIDLDYFKQINDTQGHDVGDKLLMETARRLTGAVRREDTVSRLGGDEFVVLLEYLADSEQDAAAKAGQIAENIRMALKFTYFASDIGAEHFSSSSIGITLFQGTLQSAEILLKQADLAMYQAKEAGRNAARFFNPLMQSVIDARMALLTELRHALDEEEFQLYFQPQMDERQRIVGAEALVRWQKPGGELVPPGEFIPLAEETGLILALGSWVLRTAMRQLRAWESDPELKGLVVAVNVSAKQFLHREFVQQVEDQLAETGANARLLKLELTESVIIDPIDEVVERMRRLTEIGISFALDDFGTGYSSLSCLKRLPLSQVKIDKSFIMDIPGDGNDVAIVQAILAMSRSLGLDVVAEGVETREQLDFLLAHGCDCYQGFYFARPLPVAQWADLKQARFGG